MHNLRSSAMTSLFSRGLAILAMAVLPQAGAARAEPARRGDPAHPAEKSERLLPTILLTGFEPFGPSRPANPSWEGIKNLDGKEFFGHRLICRQLKVIWGEPLKQLPQWVDELNPVAVFSFGQGGDYAIETLSHNWRAPITDNAGQLPPQQKIIDGGADEYCSTLDVDRLIANLKVADQDVRKSRNAGSYLCEETLYTLEHLKKVRQAPSVVGFFHVPPLGVHNSGAAVDAEQIQTFAEAVIAAWLESRQPASVTPTAAPTLRQPADPAGGDDKNEQEVRDLIERYFRTWSAQDITRYGQCFAPQAVVQLVDDNGGLTSIPLAPFLRSQQDAHRRAVVPMAETPEMIQIRFDANLAHALVYWKLVEGDRVEYGYDHFTFLRVEAKWKIAHLIFYALKEQPKP